MMGLWPVVFFQLHVITDLGLLNFMVKHLNVRL